MVEGVVVNFDQNISKQRRKQLYVISDNKNPDGSIKRVRLYINSVVSGPFIYPIPVNLPASAFLQTVTTTTNIPDNPSTRFPVDPSTPVEPAPVPKNTTTNFDPVIITTTTTVPDNFPTTVSPAHEPTIATTVPSNPPNTVVPEPDTTNTTRVYANPPPQNAPVPDPNSPHQNAPVPDLTPLRAPVVPVPATFSPNTSTPALVADCHGLMWYDY